MKRFLRVSLYILFLFAATFALSELVLRLFDPIGIEYVFEAKRYFRYMQRHPTYGYRHRPGVDEVFQGVHVRTNSEGFRGREFSARNSGSKQRVVVLGDSVVFGWGAKEEATLAVQLQELVPSEIEVIAAGVGSWNTRTEAEWLAEVGVGYKPDKVLLVVSSNDISPKSRGRTHIPRDRLTLPEGAVKSSFFRSPPGWYRDLTLRSYLLTAFQRFISVKNISEATKLLYSSSVFLEETSSAIDLISKTCKQHSIHLQVYLFGARRTQLDELYHQFYHKEFEKNVVPVFSFPDELYNSEYRNSLVDPHPNGAGLKIMAQTVYKEAFMSSD